MVPERVETLTHEDFNQERGGERKRRRDPCPSEGALTVVVDMSAAKAWFYHSICGMRHTLIIIILRKEVKKKLRSENPSGLVVDPYGRPFWKPTLAPQGTPQRSHRGPTVQRFFWLPSVAPQRTHRGNYLATTEAPTEIPIRKEISTTYGGPHRCRWKHQLGLALLGVIFKLYARDTDHEFVRQRKFYPIWLLE